MNFVDTTIFEQLEIVAKDIGDKKMLFFDNHSYSWQEIHDLSYKMAAELIRFGIRGDSKVAIWSSNSIVYLCAFFAIQKVGATAVLINPAYQSFEMDNLLSYVELDGIYCDLSCIQRLRSISGIKYLRYIGPDTIEQLEEAAMPRSLPGVKNMGPHRKAVMMFTSGSTGVQKGVELTHYQVLNVAYSTTLQMHWNDQDSICLPLPLFHCFGMSIGILASIIARSKIYMIENYSSTKTLQCVHDNRCTILNGVPTMFLSMLNKPNLKEYDLSSLRTGVIAGASVYEQDFIRISEEMGIPHLMQSYGQTETSPTITISNYEDSIEQRSKSVGRVIEGVEIRIRDMSTGEIVENGLDGEIEVSGYNVMEGYFKRDLENHNAFSQDGWLKTGDLGHIDEDGYLYISGRKKEIIIRGGENISPKEIEEVLYSLKEVNQVKVFGVREKVIQESIVACIESEEEIEIDKIKEHVKKNLSSYKVPKYVFTFSKFPQTASGKIDIQTLKLISENNIKSIGG